MRFARTFVLAFPSFLVAFLTLSLEGSIFAQQTSTSAPQSSPQALTLLQQSLGAMAPTPPADSTASGSVTITAGSETAHGTVTVSTKGNTESYIQFQMSNATWSVIFANGQANRVESTVSTALPLELAASSQCLYFPQPYLLSLLTNPDMSLQFIGQESLASGPTNHIRAQNTFHSSPDYQFLSEFTIVDIWLDASSALPVKISMIRRYGGGSSPKIPISFAYSNYQTVSGVRYPFTIQESVNGTPWATTTIQSVVFNTGLTDANFPILQGSN